MRFTQLLIPTLKDAPADAVVASHRYLVRAGFIRQLGAGIYSYLPLAVRTLGKIEAIIREEMNALGAQEFRLPMLHPAEIWHESGRWDEVDQTLFRFKDRRGSDLALGMTHEEIFTDIARRELRSYRELPQIWYQIQSKFRDEPRPKGGLLRVREFTMKDSYSFDIDQAGLDRAYELHRRAYERIFARCGVDVVKVEAFSGVMGGAESAEFAAPADAGEDSIAFCPQCRYAANLEIATSRPEPVVDQLSSANDPEKFPTPGAVTIEALSRPPYNIAAKRQLKSLVYVADERAVVAVLRGDDQLHDAKLQASTGASNIRPAHPEEVAALMGAHPGSLGAVKFNRAPVYVDKSLVGRTNMVTGANEDGFHLRNVDVGRDLLASGAQLADLRMVRPGEGCPRCQGALQVFNALELGHIFKLGTRYSTMLRAYVLRADGVQTPVVMGSYGIGVGRIMAAAVEQHHDANGIVWSISIAPFHVAVLRLSQESDVCKAADQVVDALETAGIEVLYDDRDERPGVKFKDADLIGIPIRIAVGRQGLAKNRSVEWKLRGTPGAPELVQIDQVALRAVELVRKELAGRDDR